YAKMQADNAASMRGAELGTNVNLANADASTKADASTAGAANQFKQTELETDRAVQLADRDRETRLALAEMDHESRMSLAQVDRATRVEMATIENNYRQLLQMNGDLATMYNQVSTNIANISLSNLDPGAKAHATQSQLNVLKEALAAKQRVMSTNAHQSDNPAGPSSLVGNLNIGQFFNGNIATNPTTPQAQGGGATTPGQPRPQPPVTTPPPAPGGANQGPGYLDGRSNPWLR
ncbi:MAG: hypothetical protein ACRCZI_00530, partial [Cetobacterium sp.]